MNKIDDILNLLKDTDNEIISNTKNLFDEINDLKNSIENNTSKSYETIDKFLNDLKDFLSVKSFEIENNNILKNEKKSEITTSYYEKILSMKNNILKYSLEESDNLISCFDKYLNNKKDLINNVIAYKTKDINYINDSFFNSLTNYQKENETILLNIKKFKSSINDASIKLSNNIRNTVSSFSNEYNKYLNNIDSLNKELEYSLNEIINESNIDLNIPSNFISILNKNFVNLLNFYNEQVKREIHSLDIEYNKESKILINHITKLLKDNLSTIKNSNDKEISELINKDEYLSKYGELLETNEDIDFSSYLIQLINEDRLKEYEKNVSLIKDKYLVIFDKIGKKDLILSLLNNSNEYVALFENKKIIEELTTIYNKTFKEVTFKRMDLLIDLEKFEIRTLNTLNNFKNDFLLYLNTIILDFNKDLSTLKLNTDYEINILNNELYIDKNTNYEELDTFINNDQILIETLKYELDYNAINLKYIIDKANIKLSFDLTKIEKEKNLLEPNFELKRIMDSYESIKKTYETIYNSELEILNRSKERNELMNLTNFKYASSFIKHKTLISKQMIELAIKEYELKLNILDTISEQSKKYSYNEINEINKNYLNRIDDLKKLKDIEIKSVLDSLESDNNLSIDSIKEKYNNLQNEVVTLIKNDPEVSFNKENINIINETILNGIDVDKRLKDETISLSNNSLLKVKNNFNSILDTLNHEDINYNLNQNTYDTDFINNMDRINHKLENDTAPLKEKINHINDSYSFNYFIDKYNESDSMHLKELNELTNNYKNKVSSLDLSTFIKNVDKKDEINNSYNNDLALLNKNYENQVLKLKLKYDTSSSDNLIKYNNSISLIDKSYSKDKVSLIKQLNKLLKNNKSNIKLLEKAIKKIK